MTRRLTCTAPETRRGEVFEPRSFITRDLSLRTYCRHKGVASPEDLASFCAGIDADLSRGTGPVRNLQERVARVTELGAVAYVSTRSRGG